MGRAALDRATAERFGSNLSTVRRGAGYTQEELAIRCCLHVSYISKLEGGIGLPGINTLVRLARSLGVSADDLLRGIEWTPCPLPTGRSCCGGRTPA
jgi:transcriptional regulator with XRE-family HTH domain